MPDTFAVTLTPEDQATLRTVLQQAKTNGREAARIHVTLLDGRRILIEQPIQHIRRFTAQAIAHTDPGLIALVGGEVIEDCPFLSKNASGSAFIVCQKSRYRPAPALV